MAFKLSIGLLVLSDSDCPDSLYHSFWFYILLCSSQKCMQKTTVHSEQSSVNRRKFFFSWGRRNVRIDLWNGNLSVSFKICACVLKYFLSKPLILWSCKFPNTHKILYDECYEEYNSILAIILLKGFFLFRFRFLLSFHFFFCLTIQRDFLDSLDWSCHLSGKLFVQ